MPSLTITKRDTKSGRRYVVRYRLGGRAYPIEHGGSFRTVREAKIRRDLIGGEIAAGRNPRELLEVMTAEPITVATTSTWAERFLASRIDIDANTLRSYRTGLQKITGTFGDTDPARITVDAVASWVAQLAGTHKPGTVRLYLRTFKMLLDFVGVDPNPARDKRVRAPKVVTDEPEPPTADHLLAILDQIHDPLRRLMFVTIEQGALRLGEAVRLTWGDVDRAGLRLRLPRSATKRDKARWVYLPEWLIEAIERSCPFDDRTPERRVFQGVTESAAYATFARACQNAGVPHYSPHSLRHRRATIWHQSGVVARELAERVGHSRASMTLDVYSHVMPLDEAPEAALVKLTNRQEEST